MERRLGELGEPYREGMAGRLGKVGKALVATGAAVIAAGGGRSRPLAAAGGAVLAAGALSARFSVFEAGFASAADPKYVVGPQRARIESGESRGASRRSPLRSVRGAAPGLATVARCPPPCT